MLINFNDIVSRYGKPKGVIHIGAHLMEERNAYLFHGLSNTIWIEANPKIYSRIRYINEGNSQEMVFNYAMTDVDNETHDLNVTNNGLSSSILELERHTIHYPHVQVEEIVRVKTKRMDSLITEGRINMDSYDFVNIDIQGAELTALKGFGDLLHHVKYIYSEVNINYLYRNCALLHEVDEYLEGYHFKRVETVMTECEWGDALYLRSGTSQKRE